ncbi:MAG: reprolysin-like metallopeptidase [Bacteroidota bacterium]|jgi:hypothetical protein
MKFFYSITFILIFFNANAQSNSFWNRIDRLNRSQLSATYVPNNYLSYSLNTDGFMQALQSAQNESQKNIPGSGLVLAFPIENGTIQDFLVYESPIFEPQLGIKYPTLKTYIGQGLNDKSAAIRFDVTYKGIHAMIKSSSTISYINQVPNTNNFIVFSRKDCTPSSSFYCQTEDGSLENTIINSQRNTQSSSAIGQTLRTYRLAMACTGEYTAFHGGTVPEALSAIVISVNRVNLVYEQEVDVRMVLIANTDTLIFTNAANDPYSNNSGSQMLGQNQTTINARIGSANYDFGHVFSTGGGGIASLGSVCSNNNKARGVTGLGSPVGDPFDIDYVAHEIGHQFAGNHTFNSNSGSCSGNRNGSTAFEPGSGVTIMAYAGICGSDNVASNSIAYFHSGSFDEIVDFITTGNGDNCAVATSTGNLPPTIETYTGNFSIPYQTAFKLTGKASDPDGDAVTYSWEEMDLGAGGAWNAVVGSAPIFRSYNPDTTATRLFPKLSNILNNLTTIGEQRPKSARTLTFRLTARDNRAGGGGVIYSPTVTLNVINTVDTFKITSQNVAGTIWETGSQQTITWNVASTNLAPINTPFVNIYLSTNVGSTFPVTIAENVPNTGSYTFFVPFFPTNTARIMVAGANNIFFDINDRNIAITASNIFAITSPNTQGVVWPIGSEQAVAWNVAFTNQAPTNVTELNVLLSTDGGQTFSTTIAENVPNTGVYSFTVPNFPTETARLKIVDGANTIFDVNDADFSIVDFSSTRNRKAENSIVLFPNPAGNSITINSQAAINRVSIYDVCGREVFQEKLNVNNSSTSLNIASISNGVYFVRVFSNSGIIGEEKIIVNK